MAKITTPSYVTGISGKVCSHEAENYKTNSSSGKIVLSKLCNPFKGPSTQLQKAARSRFVDRHDVILQWLNTNRPTKANPKGTALYQEAISIKKLLRLDNVQSALSQYQLRKSPYTIQLPSEGGKRQTEDAASSSSSQSTTKKTLTLTVSPSGAGTVTGAGDYDVNATAHITATAGDGYTFKKWNDNDTNASRDVTMSDDLTLQAVFETTSSGGSSGSGGSGWGSNNEP